MDQSTAYTDPSGRVTVHEIDDRGLADTWTAPQALDVRARGQFTELARIICDSTDSFGRRVLYVRGCLFLSAIVVPGAAFTQQYLGMEINVTGYVGSTPILLKRIGMDQSLSNQARYIWDGPEAFQAIGIEARQIVNGLPDGTVTPQALTLGLVARLWR